MSAKETSHFFRATLTKNPRPNYSLLDIEISINTPIINGPLHGSQGAGGGGGEGGTEVLPAGPLEIFQRMHSI